MSGLTEVRVAVATLDWLAAQSFLVRGQNLFRAMNWSQPRFVLDVADGVVKPQTSLCGQAIASGFQTSNSPVRIFGASINPTRSGQETDKEQNNRGQGATRNKKRK